MKKQKGMTFIGMLLTVAVVVIVATVVIRVIPVYLQYYSVIESVNSLNTTPISSLSHDSYTDAATLRRNLNKRLEINGVESLKENQVTIVPNGINKFTVTLKYQVIKSLVYNISLLFDFNHTEEVVAGSES